MTPDGLFFIEGIFITINGIRAMAKVIISTQRII